MRAPPERLLALIAVVVGMASVGAGEGEKWAPRRQLIQARLDAARLSGAVTRMDAADADHLSITFGAVPFAQWLSLVDALQAQQVRLETARIEALAASGLVSVNASFARARPQ